MKGFLKIIIALIIGLIFIIPVIWMINSSFMADENVIRPIMSIKDLFPENISLKNYRDVFKRVNFFNTIAVSFGFIFIIVFVGTIFNSACGYAFARLDFKGSSILFAIVVSLIVVPFEALAVPLFLLIGVKFDLMNTIGGLSLPYIAKAFNIFYFRQFFLSIPHDLEEAARVEGASWYRIYFTVALPMARPAIATMIVLDFVIHWSEYLWPLVITNKSKFETMQIGLGHFYTLPPIQWGDIMAYSTMATIPMFLIFIFFQKYLVRGFSAGGVKG